MHHIDFTSAQESRAFRNALGCFATGIAVVTTADEQAEPLGITVSSFASVSLDPPLVLWSLRRQSAVLPVFVANGHYIVNVLAAEQADLARHFAGTANSKFKCVEYERGIADCAALHGCLAKFECVVVQTVECGDHVIFIGQVEAASYRDGNPLIFASGRMMPLQDFEKIDASA